MNDDFSEIIKILSEKLNADFPNDSTSSDTISNTNDIKKNKDSSVNSLDNDFNIDIETLLKFKTIIDNLNSNELDERTNLLRSLKPYLQDSKKDKIEKYIKFLKFAKLFENTNLFNNDNNNPIDFLNIFK